MASLLTPVLIIVGLVLTAVLGWLAFTRSDVERGDPSDEFTAQPTVDQPAATSPGLEVESPSIGASAVEPVATTRPAPTRDAMVDGLSYQGAERLAVLRDGQISIVSLRTGDETEIAIESPVRDVGLASADGQLAYVALENAFLLSADGSTSLNLGLADAIVDGANPSVLWVGHQLDGELMKWQELNSAGSPLRETITEQTLEFNQPDLRWGHQRWFLRLTDSETRPWRLMAQGWPIAVGPNDLILKTCDDEGLCSRIWIDPQTGTDQGLLLADIANSLGSTTGGLISPEGRYLLREDSVLQATTLVALASREEIAIHCDMSSARWSAGDELVACISDEHILIHDPESGAYMTIDGKKATHLSFVFISS